MMVVFGFLTSCSMNEFKVRPPVRATCAVSNEPASPCVPYSQVDINCPLSNISSPTLYVYKNERRLLVVNEGTLVRDYNIGLGYHPNGDKSIRGDGRTPEGEFFICAKNPASKFYKSLGLSYPDPKRAQEALISGRISWDEYRSILQAIEEKKLPPVNTALGGAIFIHGGGADKDWTLGCIAVYNRVIDELFQVVSVGTPVYVMP
jgi:murein L,D-transpeptidase YafK